MSRSLSRISLFALVALLGLSLALPAFARKRKATPVDTPTEDQVAVRQLKQQIAAEELAIALTLDADQKAALAGLIAEITSAKSDKKDQRQAAAPELRALFEDYLAEVQKDGEASDSTVDAIRAFREAHKPDPSERKQMRGDVRQQLQEILSEDQRAVLREFRPMNAVGPDEERQEARRERREKRSERVRERVGDEDFEDRRQMHRKGKQRKRTRRIVRDVLLSEAMLEVLER